MGARLINQSISGWKVLPKGAKLYPLKRRFCHDTERHKDHMKGEREVHIWISQVGDHEPVDREPYHVTRTP